MGIESRIKRAAFGLFLALASTGGSTAAKAQMPGYNGYNQSQRIWRQMDLCKRQAWKEHPDYTREGSAQRDQAVKHCLNAGHAPPMSPFAPRDQQEQSGVSR